VDTGRLTAQDSAAVFFNLFAATEPSANVWNPVQLSKSLSLQPHRTVVANFIPTISAEPQAAPRVTLRFPGTPVEKHCATVCENRQVSTK